MPVGMLVITAPETNGRVVTRAGAPARETLRNLTAITPEGGPPRDPQTPKGDVPKIETPVVIEVLRTGTGIEVIPEKAAQAEVARETDLTLDRAKEGSPAKGPNCL